MAKRDQIIDFCNEFLRVKEFEDGCINGLQVEGKQEVEKVILAVTCNLPVIEAAILKGADLIIAHHGLFYGKQLFRLHGHTKKRVQKLLEHDINVAGYHLPLDFHEEVGNNVQLLRLLGFHTIERAGMDFVGVSEKGVPFAEFEETIKEKVHTNPYILQCGPKTIHKLLVVTGGGAKYVDKAMEEGLDTYVTGEIQEHTVDVVKENHINYVYAGHYNTEKYGIQALGEELKKHFELDIEFVDVPNDI